MLTAAAGNSLNAVSTVNSCKNISYKILLKNKRLGTLLGKLDRSILVEKQFNLMQRISLILDS